MSETLSPQMIQSMVSYYAQSAPMSDPCEYAPLFADLPSSIPDLVHTLQGLVVHIFWAGRYGLDLSDERQAEVQIHPVRRKLARLLELNSRPLSEPRPLAQRLVCNCRDFSLLCSSMLRSKGVPARARCGFGTYFIPNHYEDHWVVEYWKASENRWAMLDAQLDDLQKQAMNITFDTLDMPAGAFVTGGEAWQLCRQSKADPDLFGIFDMHGWDFVKGNLFRDFLSLNKFEVLPWDFWPALQPDYAEASPADLAWFDLISEFTTANNQRFDEARSLYEQTPILHAPPAWTE